MSWSKRNFSPCTPMVETICTWVVKFNTSNNFQTHFILFYDISITNKKILAQIITQNPCVSYSLKYA